MRIHFFYLALMTAIFLSPTSSFGQGGGLNAGAGAGAAYNAYQLQPGIPQQHARANHSDLVAVTGTVNVSVKPESLRLVFAVTSEANTSQECSESNQARVTKIRDGLTTIGIDPKNVVEDFIAIVPRYTWELKKLEKKDYAQEIQDGFRMQSNLHILCKDESQAMATIDVAFKAGVTEIISFDYWHSQLDQFKKEALKKSLSEAKSKAEILLSVFDEMPKVLNVDHSIKVTLPVSLYDTISTSRGDDQVLIPYSWNNLIKVKAHRPLATFYAGSKAYSDSSPAYPPMSPEISVLSTVTLTYDSPARKERMEIERTKASNRSRAEKP